MEWSVTGLAVASAVLTVDFATARWRIPRVRRIDWVGAAALLAGWTAALYLPQAIIGAYDDSWWHPRLLPSYGVGFLVCLIGRTAQKLRLAWISHRICHSSQGGEVKRQITME
jgi:hypothetical protein